MPIVGAVSQENTSTSAQSIDTINTCCAASANSKYMCFFCGGSHHNRSVCVQSEMLLASSVKMKAISQKCAVSNQKLTSAAKCSQRPATMLISNTTSASLGSLKQAALNVLVGKNAASTALMDTGSSGSFISLSYVRKHKLQMKPAAGNVSMASSLLKASTKGQCTVYLLGEWYPDVKLSALLGYYSWPRFHVTTFHHIFCIQEL